MAKIRLSEPQGLTHLRLDGFYITRDPEATAQRQKEVFLRGRLGYLNGTVFVPVSVYEERITDPAEIDAILGATVSGPLGARLEAVALNFLLQTGRLVGTIE